MNLSVQMIFQKNVNYFYFILSTVMIADHHTVYNKMAEIIAIIVEKLIMACLFERIKGDEHPFSTQPFNLLNVSSLTSCR